MRLLNNIDQVDRLRNFATEPILFPHFNGVVSGAAADAQQGVRIGSFEREVHLSELGHILDGERLGKLLLMHVDQGVVGVCAVVALVLNELELEHGVADLVLVLICD